MCHLIALGADPKQIVFLPSESSLSFSLREEHVPRVRVSICDLATGVDPAHGVDSEITGSPYDGRKDKDREKGIAQCSERRQAQHDRHVPEYRIPP